MHRLTKQHFDENGYYARCSGMIGCDEVCSNCGKLDKIVARLAAYEDTGLEPDQVEAVKHALMGQEIAKIVEFDGVPLKRLQELAQAEKDRRLVVLDEPCRPLIWGDDARDTVLCPNCKRDLMGGFPEADSCETPMCQCPYCGQPIDGTKALTREEAEAALKGGIKMGIKNCDNCKHLTENTRQLCASCVKIQNAPPSNWEAGPNYIPMTNADRIRAMSDEEMANFLFLSAEMEFDVCRLCEYGNPTPQDDRGMCLNSHDFCSAFSGAKAFTKWLQQPAEE